MKEYSQAVLALLIAFSAQGAGAQSTAPIDVCNMESDELLQMLEGVWSVKQESGRAMGTATVPILETSSSIRRMIPLMLKEREPVELEMKYMPGLGVNVFQGQGQSMMLALARPERASEEIRHQQEQAGDPVPNGRPDCASGSLPVFVGTNNYRLQEGPPPEPELREAALPLSPFNAFCTNDPIFELLVHSGVVDEEYGATRTVDDSEGTCEVEPEPAMEPGDMRMTLVVEFESVRSGSGYVYYTGELEGIVFSAIADLTLSR